MRFIAARSRATSARPWKEAAAFRAQAIFSQTLTNAQVLTHLLDCGMDVQSAVELMPSGNLAGGADFRREAFALGV
jgi:hypothetical protein